MNIYITDKKGNIIEALTSTSVKEQLVRLAYYSVYPSNTYDIEICGDGCVYTVPLERFYETLNNSESIEEAIEKAIDSIINSIDWSTSAS